MQIKLSKQGAERVLKALQKPPAPCDALKAAAKRYQERSV